MTNYYQVAQNLAASLPPLGGDLCKTARKVVVNRIKGLVPGRYESLYLGGDGDPFLQIFFPNYKWIEYEDAVTNITGLASQWWTDFAVSTLCQCMYHQTRDLRKLLLIDAINRDVESRNSTFQDVAYQWYGHVLSLAYPPYRDAVNAVPDKATLALTYVNHLDSDAWVTAKMLQYSERQWLDQYWELFNHWTVMLSLGRNLDQVNATIRSLKAKGLNIPGELDADNWTSYLGWMSNPNLNWEDLKQEATPGILKEVCTTYIGSVSPICTSEAYSQNFTINSQPGHKYRTAPGSSCFSANTLVLLADGTSKPIAEVAIGDSVQGSQGTAKVQTIAQVSQHGRRLVSINGYDFGGTSSHPWLTYSGWKTPQEAPHFAAATPWNLIHNLPFFAPWGVTTLSPNLRLVGFQQGQITAVPVERVEPWTPKSSSDALYDLVVEMDEHGRSEYFVGAGNGFVLVASEIPRADTDLATAQVILSLFEKIWPYVHGWSHSLSLEALENSLSAMFRAFSGFWLPQVMINYHQTKETGETTPSPLRIDPAATLRTIAQSFVKPDGSYDAVRGVSLALLMRFFGQAVYNALNLGWRRFALASDHDVNLLAVSIFHLELCGLEGPSQKSDMVLEATLQSPNHQESHSLHSIESGYRPGFFIGFNQVLYFSSWSAPTTKEEPSFLWELILKVSSASKTSVLAGKVILPPTMQTRYLLAHVPMYDPQNRWAGELGLDFRLLTLEQRQTENDAKRQWSAQDRTCFANAFVPLAWQVILPLLPQVAEQFFKTKQTT